jgi:hypothetical protein
MSDGGHMRTKVVGYAILLAVFSSAAYWIYDTRSNRKARELETAETKSAVEQLSSRYNAVADWEMQLSNGKADRSSSILSFELERIWLRDRPVLFVGSIKDISTNSDDTYQVTVSKSGFKLESDFETVLRLSLRAPKATIDIFLKQNPDLLSSEFPKSGIAVVAKITNVSATDMLRAGGELLEIKTGHGQLLGLVYSGGVFASSDEQSP